MRPDVLIKRRETRLVEMQSTWYPEHLDVIYSAVVTTMTYQDVLNAARQLPEGDRALLVDELMGTLAPESSAPLDDVWLAEIERRSAAFDAGEVDAIPWSEVRNRARRRLRTDT